MSSSKTQQEGSTSERTEMDKGCEAIVPESIRSNKRRSFEQSEGRSSLVTDLVVAEEKAENQNKNGANIDVPRRNAALGTLTSNKRSRVSNISEAKRSAFSEKVQDTLQLLLTKDKVHYEGDARDRRARKMIDELTTSEITNLSSTKSQSAEPKHGVSTSDNKQNPVHLAKKYITEGGVIFL